MAVSFMYRFYASPGGGCSHTSPDNDSFPLIHLEPLTGSNGECLSAPTGINWTTVELNNNLVNGTSMLTTFCDAKCTGNRNIGQSGPTCYGAGPGCHIGSFIVTNSTTEVAPSGEFGGNATVTVSVVATAVATDSPQALPSTQQQGDLAPQESLTGILGIVGGILLGFTAIFSLMLTAYYWKRRRDAKLKMTAPSPLYPLIPDYNFSSQLIAANGDHRGSASVYSTNISVDYSDTVVEKTKNDVL
ncbi:hypothetical protein BJ912DRAFT_1149965 [Pholiota molesta]|nr:hypothetical protein BJ912DRAFT_1149965 [Pholiota molesta]